MYGGVAQNASSGTEYRFFFRSMLHCIQRDIVWKEKKEEKVGSTTRGSLNKVLQKYVTVCISKVQYKEKHYLIVIMIVFKH